MVVLGFGLIVKVVVVVVIVVGVVVVIKMTVMAVLVLIVVLLWICLKSMRVYFLLLLPVDGGYFGD